ncbi:uncharacterized protein LOC142176491 [Nicotiana tabacum]|uniref:Uncharacterized protein LOC142176491 n=1 Tax=Nicotiana tabacum TaxID=4097 RepID=A0AC58TTD8_TOBAC
MDHESTTQHLMNATRQGDLSPTQVEKAKSAAKGKKKQQKDNFAALKPGVHTRRTLTKSNNQINGAKATSKKLERYRSKVGLAQAISNVSNKIRAFIDEVFERIELWDSLYAMARDMDAPWLVGGVFNVIWDEEEKFGGLPVSLNEIDDFRHCVNTCNLFDLGFKGSIYTWWNGRAEEDCKFKKLDRCLVNLQFQQTFPGIEVQHLSKTGSDHSPMYLKCDIDTPPIKNPFKFLNFWVEHETFKDVVKENWTADFSANPYILFNHKLKKLKKALSLWSTATFGDIFQKIASMEEVVMVHEAEFEANPTGKNRERLQKVQAELINCLALEKKYWQQKAGMTWFKEGDRNTKLFHAQVRGRRKRLQLNRIQNSGGTWIEEEQEIAEEAIKFYEEQFTKGATPSLFDIVEHVPILINTKQNAELIKQPTKEEVKVAVLELNGDSAGGPDGMTGKFYHSCWDIIGDDLYDMVRDFFNGHELPKCVTHTNLVLLPKKKEVTTFSDLRPISLSNFSNKVISRVVHERLVKFLPSLISEEQSGFVKGRNIVENILLTQKIVTDIRLRTKAGPNVILKLDMTKAYDRLSWLFLTKQKHLNALNTNLYFCGFGMPKWSPKINHLVYADDMIIFSSSDETPLMLIMQVLNAYEAASGQLVNKTKSVVYLHHLTDMEVVSKVERITGIHRNDFPIIYLGCPIFYARRKLEYYQPLITKVMDKLQSWLHKLFAQFLWSSSVGGTSRHWASWNTLCMPVEEGGIGFRSLHDVAKALFSKLWGNFRTKPSLWRAFVCQKYCKKLNSVIVPWKRGSHIWRKMLECRDLIEHQIFWQTKRGSSLFWFENWTGLGALYFLVPQNFGIDETVHNVHDVTLDGEWDVDRLFEMLPEDLAVHILEKIKPPSPQQVLDMPCWMLETRGYFSVKSAWDYTRRRDEPRTAYRMIWVKGLPFKIAFFMWKVWKEKLPLDDFLKRPDEKSLQHLFFRSETARTTWNYFLTRAGISVEGLTLHQAITKCWTANVCLRLKPALVKVRKHGMDMVPHKWQDLLAMMENFTPKLKVTKVMWEFPSAGWLKFNTDGASRGNPGRSSIGFCIRNENGDIVKSVGKEIEETTNIVAEAKAMVEALRFCRFHQYSHVWLQTDSMLLKKIMVGIWKPPWIISEQVPLRVYYPMLSEIQELKRIYGQ